jgi:putative DNA primase/helicase
MRDDEMAKIIDLQARMGADWQSGLAKKGREAPIVGDERNVLAALRSAPELRGLVRYDEFALSVELTRSPPWRHCELGERWTEDDDTQLMAFLQAADIAVRGKSVVADCVSVVAKDCRVHPVREYLHSVSWDGSPRLDSWLTMYLGAEPSDYVSGIGRKWLVSAVARVERPGCQADHVLVLEARQGAGKSTAARILAVRLDWFADNVGDLGNKDSMLQLAGKWIIELSELAAIRRAELEQVKGYISRTQDTFRPPYGRRAVTIPRQCVFIGSTNEREYLRDRTGNRRYWPVPCGRIDLEALYRDRDQLWAEARAMFEAGEQWHLTGALAAVAACEQDGRVLQTELEADVAEYLERIANIGRSETTARDLFVYALKLNPQSPHYAEQAVRLGAQLSAAVERAGWSRVGTRGRGATKRTVYRRNLTKTHQENLEPLHAGADEETRDVSSVILGEPRPRACPDCDGVGCNTCGEFKAADGTERIANSEPCSGRFLPQHDGALCGE